MNDMITNDLEHGYQSTDLTNINSNTSNNDENNNNKIGVRKLQLTIIYCISFWNFGIGVALFGPTLLDLACQTSSTLSAMSFLYFMQNFTSLLGCFLSGLIIKKKLANINDILLVGTILMPICISLMPLTSHIFYLGLVMSILGFNMGCIDNIANLAILKLHKNNVSPYIQTMHFFYGVGAFLTPLIVKCFLNSNFDFTVTSSSLNCYSIQDVKEFIHDKPYIPSIQNPKENIISLIKNGSFPIDKSLLPNVFMTRTKFTSQTKYAFWILSLIQLPAPITLLLIKLKPTSEYENNLDMNDLNDQEEPTTFSLSINYLKSLFKNLPVLQLTLLMAFLVFLFEGLQASHGGYIFSYIVEKYDIESKPQSNKLHKLLKNDTLLNRHHYHHSNELKDDEAYITAIFWAFFSIGRLVSIYGATKFSATFMLFIDIVGCLVSTLIMLISTFFASISLLYISTSLLGLFLSNTTPTTYSLAEIHIGATPTLTSFIIICAATGEMVIPLIVANLFETAGPNSFIIAELIVTISAALAFARFIFYANVYSKSFDSRDSFIWLRKNFDSNQNNNSSQNKNEFNDLIGKSSNLYYSKMEED